MVLLALWLWSNSAYNLFRASTVHAGSGAEADVTDWLRQHGCTREGDADCGRAAGAAPRANGPAHRRGHGANDRTGAPTLGEGTSTRARFSHRCSACGECFGYMDHHCPFVYNCIGVDNFVFYFLFLVYATGGAVLSLVVSLPPFLGCVLG